MPTSPPIAPANSTPPVAPATEAQRREHVLRERAARYAGRQRAAQPQGAEFEALQFTVGTSRFAVPLSVLEEVRTAVPVAPIPGAPAELAGVFSLRGELALALDLLRLLGLAVPADLPACRHLLVLRARASSVGLAISELKAVRRVAPAALHPPTEAGLAALGSHALGVTTDGVVLLDWRQICRLPIFQSL